MNKTDKELIDGIKNGSNKVWGDLFSTPQKDIRALVQPLMKDVRDVTFDDIFEEACIILMEDVKSGKLDGEESNLKGYLYVICKRLAMKCALKKRAVSSDETPLADVWAENAGTPEDEIDDEEMVNTFLARVLEAMPANQRVLLKQFYWDRMSMKEIAAANGLKNEKVAKSTKKRYMDNFKNIAAIMLENDELAEAAIARTVERKALRDQMDECRHLEAGVLTMSYCKDDKRSLSDKELIEGILENSPTAWKALYATMFDSLKDELGNILE